MRSFRGIFIVLVFLVHGVHAAPAGLVIPPEFKFKVEFWKAVYTKYTTNQGILHDSEDLSLIYDAIELPRNGDTYGVDHLRAKIRETIFNILRKGGENLTYDERQLLAKFPKGVTRSRLLQATENIRFQRGQKDRFREGVIRSGYYMKHIEKIVAEEGLPEFIKYLPHVESSFQEFAISKFGAAGLWQLMPDTGRQYLRVTYEIDERLDPWIATRGAAKHLKRDFKTLGAWPLALTAYNHGTGGLLRAVRSLGTTDIAEIAFRYQSPSFGFASRNFYGQFLAAVEVASNHEKYFGPIAMPQALEFEAIVLRQPTFLKDFEKQYRYKQDDFKRLNPGLRPPVLQNRRPIPKGVVLRVPLRSRRTPDLLATTDPKAIVSKEAFVPSLKGAEKKVANVQTPSRYAVQGLVQTRGWVRVEMNETIAQLAEWLAVSPESIREWNGMDRNAQVRLGQKVLIRLDAVSAKDFEVARDDYHRGIREDFFSRYEVYRTMDYRVMKGENLWSLCYQKFEIPAWLLQDYNPNASLADLSPSTRLKIPMIREKSDLVGSSALE